MATRNLCIPVFQQFRINHTNRMYHKLFVRYSNSQPDKMSFDFFYPLEKSAKIKKHFSFLRSKDEEVNGFLSRIKTKVNVEFEKIIKRELKKKKSEADYLSYVLDNVSVSNIVSEKEINGTVPLHEFFVENSILKLNSTEYVTFLNTPLIVSIKLPRIIICNCPVLPIVSLEYGELADVQFEWFVSTDTSKWKSVHNGLTFTASNDHVHQFVKVVCTCDKTEQKLESTKPVLIVECPAQESLSRRWQLTPGVVEDPKVVRLMTYNVLADVYSGTELARTSMFRHCAEQCLTMDYRRHLLMREVSEYHCDVICFQEMDSVLYEDLWLPGLREAGYQGLFMAKNGVVKEGQAIFWRRAKLTLVEDISRHSLSDLILADKIQSSIGDQIRSSGDQLQRWMEMRQCMAGCVLETRTGDKLVIANTHLYFRPEAETMRLYQMAAILAHVESTKAAYPEARVIVCGDFNDSRGSAVIELLEQARVNVSISDTETMSVCHGLSLASAYEGHVTNYVLDFSGELDFIYYDRDCLSCQRTLPLPSLIEITDHVALPNEHFPSDHLALVADLRLL